MAHQQSQSPVSPIGFQPIPAAPAAPQRTSTAQTHISPTAGRSSTFEKGSWLPFTLQWYYLIVPTILSLLFGGVLVYLSILSRQNHGIGPDNGSSAILFGWRFMPTLVAVLYAQMTVILFEDAKRSEPFARLATAPAGGASAYGTLLQTPRAWWSIFIDVCFRRKRIGHTSWTLICAAFINVIALLAISPLSSAFLTSEEILVPKSIEFSRIVPKANTQIPMIPSRDTYYRTMNAVMRNVTTSAWLNDTSLTFPFWPTSESAQFGPNLASSYAGWSAETTSLQYKHQCQDMTLKSAEIAPKHYSGVYVLQGYGPINGTQPMATFVLESGDGCRYELSIHPGVDMAVRGGMTWSVASTFMPTADTLIPIGGRVFVTNMTSTDVWSRVNASEQCHGRDIIIASTPFSLLPYISPQGNPMVPENATYHRASGFRMRALLCDFEYHMSTQTIKAAVSGNPRTVLSTASNGPEAYREVPKGFINIPQFQETSTEDDWLSYFDSNNMPAGGERGPPGFSGMAPLLGVFSGFNISAIIDDPDLVRRIGLIKGRHFMEMLRDSFTNPELVESDTVLGEASLVETRVVVVTEIGITLAALFFVSSILLVAVFWSSRLCRRPLNLRSDPASTVGLGLMFNQRLARSSTIKSIHAASRVDSYTALQREKYFTSDNELHKGDNNTDPPIKVKAQRNWRPRVIHVRMLLLLGIFLAIVLVAVLILNAFSARSQLSQRAFIFEADVSKLRLSFSTFAPISIGPTLVSIIVGLWWDQLDSTFRVLQPFISMSRGPTPINTGAGLTYRSKSWAGAALKAGRNKHWVLFMIAVGSVLAQVLTVSMSALFERETRSVTRQVSVPQGLEMRQVPLITHFDPKYDNRSDPISKVLNDLYKDAPNNWLYGAGIQHSYNGSQLPWTAEGWSFLPVDLSRISNGTISRPSSVTNAGDPGSFSANITIKTPAIRARLNCRAVDEIANVSSWLESGTLSNEDELWPEDQWAQINKTAEVNTYYLPKRIFVGSTSQTTLLSRPATAVCCTNGTLADPQRAVMGYWSVADPLKVDPPESEPDDFPYLNISWPMSITTKWLVGKAFNLTEGTGTSRRLFFNEAPRIQAARCEPIIETADATVILDKDTGHVISHTIEETATAADAAWKDVFVQHKPDQKTGTNESSPQPVNVTTSFGVLFLDSLLGTADRSLSKSTYYETEASDHNAFTFRDAKNGINMDLMTYSMYTLAEKDPEALLNFTTLATYADRTFQAFFQHFVNSGLSLTKGGFVYQSIGDNSMANIGRPLRTNGTIIQDEKNAPILNTSRTVTASMSHRIRVLHMNVIATYLSAAILIWLILTTFIVVCLQRRYTSFMNRDVQLIGDMLILIAGSDNFLELVAQKGVDLKKSRDIKTMLGWFKDRDGQVRWGIEVVGGMNAVDWVDAPKHGFHVPNNTSKSASSLFAWMPWRKP